MNEHVVLFEGRPEQLEALDRWLDGFMAESRGMPGCVLATWGRNVNPRGAPYTHFTMMRFTDQAALDAYNASPAHTRFVERLPELTVQRIVLDATSNDAPGSR